MARLLLSILLCISYSYGIAQALDEKDFVHYTVDDGLSDNFVTNIQQDEWGYIWISTDAGLNRFDGHTFQVYTPSTPGLTLLSGKISRLKRLDAHHLGILDNGGFQLLDTRDLSLKNFIVPDSTGFRLFLNRAWDVHRLRQGGSAVSANAG